MNTFSAPKGTFDVIPPRSASWLAVKEALSAPPRASGYAFIETPIFEDTALFVRGVGESTDVVSKEMYTFEDRGGRSLTLRPEGTASVLRAIVEHGLDRGGLPVKVWYAGPNFRYERPQSGRYRQHTQVGVETVGSADPAIDAEVIWLASHAYANLGLSELVLLLNSLGCKECRPRYREALQEFLSTLDLDDATRERAAKNPLRVLDDKRDTVKSQLVDAPLIVDFLCEDCRAHHEQLKQYLSDLDISWVDEPRLVRGLDYYTRTLFEFSHPGLGAQSAIGGGGRYDGLLETLGGKPQPGIGFGLGVDRTLLACEAEGLEVGAATRVDVFVVAMTEGAKTLTVKLLSDLRALQVRTDMEYAGKGLKGAMKSADRSGAKLSVIIGDREVEAGVAEVKNMATGEQQPVSLAELIDYVKGTLK